MSTGDLDGQESTPVFNEQEQIGLFQRRLDSIKIDRRQALAVFAAAGGAVALAACGSNNNKSSTNNAATKAAASASAAGGAAKPASPGAAAASAAGGGGPTLPPAGTKLAVQQTFRWPSNTEPSSHDFNKDLYCAGEQELWAGLTRFNPNLQPIPDIAEKWTINADGSVYTFSLRKDSKWTNGQPVTARDFDYSYRRQMNPDTKAPYASFLYDIKNAEAYNTGKIKDDKQLGLKVVDDYTFEITLEGPRAYWPALMAYAAAYPSYKDAVDKFGDKWTSDPANIVSNGPFKMTKWDHDKSLEFVKHDGYWNAKNITLTKIVRPIISADGATPAYENGEIDWSDKVNASDYKRVFADPKLSKEVIKYNLDGTWYLVPEIDKAPFDVLAVRQAMAHAIDRDSIIKNVLLGVGAPAFSFNPPGTPGYNANKYDEFTKFDPQTAKDLLKGTKYEGGKNWPPITMSQRTQEGDGPVAAGDAIIQMLGDTLGMKIDHEVGDRKEVYNRMYQRKLQLIWLRWYEDYPDPNDEQNLVFYSKAGGTDGHRQAWSNADYDKLIVAAAGEPDAKKRLDLYAQADAIMAKEASALFVYYPNNVGLLKPNIGGMPKDSLGNFVPSFNIFVNMYDYMYVTAA